MPSIMTAGFLRDTTSRALVVVGLSGQTFSPLEETQELGETEQLYSQGTLDA